MARFMGYTTHIQTQVVATGNPDFDLQVRLSCSVTAVGNNYHSPYFDANADA